MLPPHKLCVLTTWNDVQLSVEEAEACFASDEDWGKGDGSIL
jgi:hypothetical protein